MRDLSPRISVPAPIRRCASDIRARPIVRFLPRARSFYVRESNNESCNVITDSKASIKSRFGIRTFLYSADSKLSRARACRSGDWRLSEQTKFPSGGYKCCPYNFAMRNDVHAKAYLASRIDIEAGRVT